MMIPLERKEMLGDLEAHFPPQVRAEYYSTAGGYRLEVQVGGTCFPFWWEFLVFLSILCYATGFPVL